MNREEIEEIIANLREAADTLSHVREDLDRLEIVPSTVTSMNGKLKLHIDRGVLSAEVALREALEPIDILE